MRNRYLVIGVAVLTSPVALALGAVTFALMYIVAPAIVVAIVVEIWWIIFHVTP